VLIKHNALEKVDLR